MQTSVKLQGLFSYPIWVLIIAVAIFVFLRWFKKYLKKKQGQLSNKNLEKIPEKNIKDADIIKKKYLKQLSDIEEKFQNNMINTRVAYQKISEAMRMFVFEMTDITTQNYSLAEIKKLNLPILYELIEEYYEPEFAHKSEGDFNSSINKARRVIDEWN